MSKVISFVKRLASMFSQGPKPDVAPQEVQSEEPLAEHPSTPFVWPSLNETLQVDGWKIISFMNQTPYAINRNNSIRINTSIVNYGNADVQVDIERDRIDFRKLNIRELIPFTVFCSIMQVFNRKSRMHPIHMDEIRAMYNVIVRQYGNPVDNESAQCYQLILGTHDRS